MELVIKWIADLANGLFDSKILPAELKWVILGVVFLFLELAHRAWMVIWFAIGAAAAAAVSYFIPEAQLIQIGVFFAVTSVSLGSYIYVTHILWPPPPEHTDHPVPPGSQGICVKSIGPKSPGSVRIHGSYYTARLANGFAPIKKDDWVIAESFDKNEITVLVRPLVVAAATLKG